MDSPNSRASDLWFAVRMPFLWRWRLGYWAWDSALVAWQLVFSPRRPKGMREWLVIEDSRKNGVFAPDEAKAPKGFITRDVAERVLGRRLDGTQWFTRDESDLMRAQPEWTTNMDVLDNSIPGFNALGGRDHG